METTGKAALAEFVASLSFVFLGAGAMIAAGPSGAGLVGVALASGFAFAVVVSLTRHVSGGHVNPAVTVGLWVVGRVTTPRALVYVLAQLSGAVVGALLLRVTVPEPMWRAAHLGTPLLAADLGTGRGVVLEAILAFFLVFAFLGTVEDGRGPFAATAGLTVGLVLVADILAAGPLTGAAVGPARAFGPGLVSGTWGGWWVYWVGPVAGGVIAAVVYWAAFLRDGEPVTP